MKECLNKEDTLVDRKIQILRVLTPSELMYKISLRVFLGVSQMIKFLWKAQSQELSRRSQGGGEERERKRREDMFYQDVL